MNCPYTIPLCNFGFAFRHATCVIVKGIGKALLQTNPPGFSFHTNYPNGNRYLKLPSVVGKLPASSQRVFTYKKSYG